MDEITILPKDIQSKISEHFLIQYFPHSLEKSCHDKCLNFKEVSLSNPERECLRNCTSKYYESNDILAKTFFTNF